MPLMFATVKVITWLITFIFITDNDFVKFESSKKCENETLEIEILAKARLNSIESIILKGM